MKLSSLVSLIQKADPIPNMSTKLICIDGCGGAGKSTLANALSAALNNCPIIHTDDFATPTEPLSWFNRMLNQVLIPLSSNKPAHYQKYDWSQQKLTEWTQIEPCEYLIIEGVSSCRLEFRPFISFAIYVDLEKEERLSRGLKRDGEQARDLWHEWMKEEDKYLENHKPMSFAHQIIRGDSSLT